MGFPFRKKKSKEPATPEYPVGRSVVLDEATKAKIKEIQRNDLQRAINALSTLTFSETKMKLHGLKSATSIAVSALGFADNDLYKLVADTAVTVEEKRSSILALLKSCWRRVVDKVKLSDWVKEACSLFEVGLDTVLAWAQKMLFSSSVLDKLVPIYGKVKDMIKGAAKGFEIYDQVQKKRRLVEMSPNLDQGYPRAAMEAFIKYAERYIAVEGVKVGWAFTKGIGGILCDVFSAGAATAVSFVTDVVEAIAGFVKALIQAKVFDSATKSLVKYRVWGDLPPVDKFRAALNKSPILGCVFFAMAPKIGKGSLINLLSPPNDTVTSGMLNSAMASLDDATATAKNLLKTCSFSIEFRHDELRQKYGRPIEGLL